MAEDFQTHTGIAWNGNVGTVQYDSTKVVMFYTKAKHNAAKSVQAGSPQYEDVIYVRIHPPGERLNIVDRPATHDDQGRYPVQWNQFIQNKEQIPDGVPIDLLYPDHPSVGAMLRANGVHTVEQCAEMSAAAIQNVGMGAQQYSNDATKYLQAANKGVKASQLRHELDARDNEIRTLTRNVETLKGEVDRLLRLNSQSVQLEQVQQLISGQQGRPQYPAGAPKQLARDFDAQTAQINATHITADLAKDAGRKRTRSRIKA